MARMHFVASPLMNADAIPAPRPTVVEGLAALAGQRGGRWRHGAAGPLRLGTHRDMQQRNAHLPTLNEERPLPPWHPESGRGRRRDERRPDDAPSGREAPRTVRDFLDRRDQDKLGKLTIHKTRASNGLRRA